MERVTGRNPLGSIELRASRWSGAQEATCAGRRTMTRSGHFANRPSERQQVAGGRTDRPSGACEAMHRPRSLDYVFTLAETRLDDGAGKGVGKLSVDAKVGVDTLKPGWWKSRNSAASPDV